MKNITNQHKGIIGTVLLHCLLLFCFFFFGFKTPLPLPPEEGIEIDMGGGGGGGSSEPMDVKPANSSTEEYVTQNVEESYSVSDKKEKKVTPSEPVKPVPVVNQIALYKKGSNSSGNGTGNGSGNGSGVGPGSGSGDGGGNGSGHGTGTGAGRGPGFSLTGRQAKSLPAPEINNVQGSVVVRIKVDQSGKVVDAEAISKGSTIASVKVWRKCEEFALKAKFSPKPDAPEVQQGSITYIIE